MMYICKIRSAPPSSPPSPPSAPVAAPARACPTGSAPPVSMKTMTRIIKATKKKTITDLAEMVDNACSDGISQNVDRSPEPERKVDVWKPFCKIEVSHP